MMVLHSDMSLFYLEMALSGAVHLHEILKLSNASDLDLAISQRNIEGLKNYIVQTQKIEFDLSAFVDKSSTKRPA